MITISQKYQELNQRHHEDCLKKGSPWGRGVAAGPFVDEIAQTAMDVGAETILDYGSGHGEIARVLRNVGFRVWEYDPGIPEKVVKPDGIFDMVICLDVLEHIEPEYIDNALLEIAVKTRTTGFFTIFTRPAKHILPDGSNAHRTVKNREWWEDRLSDHFTLVYVKQVGATQILATTGKGIW